MKVCPNCHTNYPDDGNFCPQEACATAEGPRRLVAAPEAAPPRFEQASRIGGSRSGEVWRARDTQTNEDVAYKVVAAEVFPSPAGMERATRELKQLTRAQNPHVARIIDFGKTAEGRLFVATELLNGQPLDQLVQQGGALPLERAKKIAAQIGEALLEGQKVGVIHHDLSAKNILIGDGDSVKVTNFAVPRPLTETVFGVPEYLSPEQAEGKLVDQRSNTYSLGAILMLMLTGETPVSGADEKEVLENVLKGDVTPPSKRRPGLGADVDRVVMKALEKSSSRRPLTLRQFLTDVAGLSAPVEGGEPKGASIGSPAQPNFAKTMMFTGGAPEVRKLVAEAIAARAEANGSGPTVGFSSPAAAAAATPPPVASEPAPAAALPVAEAATADSDAGQPTPPPEPAAAAPQVTTMSGRRHGAAVAATMVALPAQAGPIPGASGGGARLDANMVTPSPVVGAQAAAGGGPKGGPAGKGANFRETLWFKKGDVEQMVAEAKAKAAASGKPAAPAAAEGEGAPSETDLPVVDEGKPLEDRYLDDGSVTVEDRKKFSLRSGGTATAMPVVGKMPGERMSENEMLDEIGGRKKIMIIGIAAAVVLALIAVVAVAFKGKSPEKSVEALTPVNKPTEPVKAAEPPPAPAAAAAAPAAAPPAPAAKEPPPPSAPVIKEPASAPKPRAAAPSSPKKKQAASSTKKKQAASGKKKH